MRNEETLQYNSEGVARLASSEQAAAWFARILPGQDVASHVHPDCEDNAFVISGTLTYSTGMADANVPRGGWVIARPTEHHGYRNTGDQPLHLLIFTPSTGSNPTVKSEIRARVFRPAAGAATPVIYQTRSSMGQQFLLSPGVHQKVEYARSHAVFVLEGRIMTLMAGSKVSLDHGEGIFIRRSIVDLVGVAGSSTVAVFTTRP